MSATPASDLLRSEHRLVEEHLDRLLSAVKHLTVDMISEVRGALSAIQDISRPHFEKEEGVLYRHLRSRFPQLLEQLDEQHEYAREVESHLCELLGAIEEPPSDRQIAELVRFSTELCDVIQHHIVEEEEQLLRLSDSRLSQEEQYILAEAMKKSVSIPCRI